MYNITCIMYNITCIIYQGAGRLCLLDVDVQVPYPSHLIRVVLTYLSHLSESCIRVTYPSHPIRGILSKSPVRVILSESSYPSHHLVPATPSAHPIQAILTNPSHPIGVTLSESPHPSHPFRVLDPAGARSGPGPRPSQPGLRTRPALPIRATRSESSDPCGRSESLYPSYPIGINRSEPPDPSRPPPRAVSESSLRRAAPACKGVGGEPLRARARSPTSPPRPIRVGERTRVRRFGARRGALAYTCWAAELRGAALRLRHHAVTHTHTHTHTHSHTRTRTHTPAGGAEPAGAGGGGALRLRGPAGPRRPPRPPHRPRHRDR